MRRQATAFVVCVMAAAAGRVPAGQTAAPTAARPAAEKENPSPRAGAQPGSSPAAPAPYTYVSRGRRDPFVNLLATGTELPLASRRGDGAAGWTVTEISVRGIMESRGGFIALVRGPDEKTFVMHPGDKFLDGTIKTITPQGLVIVQEVNDPLSRVKQREIRKQLRTFEDTQ